MTRTLHDRVFPCLIAALALWGVTAHGQYVRRTPPLPTQTPAPPTGTPAERPAPPEEEGSIEIEADRLEYDADRTLMIGIGNVMVRQHHDILRADYIEVNTQTRDARARGNVMFDRAGKIWEGQEFTYNFRTREGDFGEFRAFSDPYYITAKESQQVGPSVFELRSGRLTTCSGDQRQEFVLRARRATITDGHVLRARHVVAHLYGLPVFYTPYLKKDLSRRSNFEVVPGYSSRMGAFLLTSYNFYPVPHVRSSTQLDYRTKRGIGLGQRLRWRTPDQSVRGRFQAYYINDDLPIRGEGQQAIREGLVDSERYWLGFQHAQSIDARNTLFTDINYVSDPFILEDFFDREFMNQVQPENRVTLSHRGDDFTAALQLNTRLNDFFGNVNRMPELSLDFNRRQIVETPLYYEGSHSAAYLERVFPKQAEGEDYDAFRIDTSHTVLYPMRHFGFLSFIPSVGYRGTWYSSTLPETITLTNQVPRLDEDGAPLLDEDGIPLFDEEIETQTGSSSADLRNVFTFQLESSFKAFKVLNEYPNYLGTGLRHMAEPYATYTLVPEPNLLPSDLYQFDDVDRLGERHEVLFGLRNKLQTRRGDNMVHDFIDLNTYTIYYLDPDENQNDFSDFFFDARVRLTDWMSIYFEGAYDWYENQVNTFNTQLGFFARDLSRVNFEYRYARDRRHMVQGDFTLFPQEKWSYSAYWRYDIDNEELEEQTYLLQRRFDCTRLGIGLRGRLDSDNDMEWRAWAQVSLLAFPDSEIRLGR